MKNVENQNVLDEAIDTLTQIVVVGTETKLATLTADQKKRHVQLLRETKSYLEKVKRLRRTTEGPRN